MTKTHEELLREALQEIEKNAEAYAELARNQKSLLCFHFSGLAGIAYRALQSAQAALQTANAVPNDPALIEVMRKVVSASDNLGFWMSAALEDKAVCHEMRADILAWFDSLAMLEGFLQNPTNSNCVANESEPYLGEQK